VTYVAVVMVVAAAVGAVMLLVIASARRGSDETAESVDHTELTDRSVRPPADPEAPLPGSAPDRRRHGKP
jgi:hypothetical protein